MHLYLLLLWVMFALSFSLLLNVIYNFSLCFLVFELMVFNLVTEKIYY